MQNGIDLDAFDGIEDQGEFNDPVLRCDSCQALVKRLTLHKIGSCDKCGNKRVRNLTVFNEVEKAEMEKWGYHDFVKQYEVVPNE